MAGSTWRAVALAATVALVGGDVWAQTMPAQKQATEAARSQRPVAGRSGPGRPGGPGEIGLVQNMIDTWALVEAQKQLELTDDQYSSFVPRMTKLNTARRRHMADRTRLLGELRQLLRGATPASDDAIADKVRAIDDLNQRSGQELRQLAAELDGTLTPYQRARFRLFEELIELRKIDMLLRVRGRAQGAGK